MRVCCVIIAISAVLASVSVAEAFVAKRFCTQIENSVKEISDKIKAGTISTEDIDKVDKVWENNKTAVFTFANHNLFKEYEDCISEMYYCCRYNLKDKLNYIAYYLLEVNNRMRETVKFSLANIF